MAEGDTTRSPDTAFYVVLALVFTITVGSLGLALRKSSDRTAYVYHESEALQSMIPKGDASGSSKDLYNDIKSNQKNEENNQQNLITILMGVFQAGTGAILGLLTGRVTSK